MAFGFVAVKFSLFIKQLSFAFAGKAVVLPGKGYPALIEIFLVALGAFVALLSFFRYKSIQKHLNSGSYYPSFVLVIMLTLAIPAGSIFLMLYLLSSI